MLKNLLKQAIKFVGLSGIGWLLDFGTYTIIGFFSENLFLNNTISSWVGVTFVFLFSTRMVFSNNSKIPLKVKYVIYLLYQCVLIYLISKLLSLVAAWIMTNFTWQLIVKLAYLIAKVLVTPITMTLNFFVMKGIIEKI